MYLFKVLQADVLVKNGIGTPEQRQAMIDLAQQRKVEAQGLGLEFSNDGCWRQEFEYPDIEWLMTELRDSTNKLINHYAEADPIYHKKLEKYGQPEVSYWTNINETGSRNAIHDHMLHHYVACYYLQGENTGDIIFHNPQNVTMACHPHGPFVSRYTYSPKDGDLLVWPAWVPHETEINKSNRQRINVAFNIRFETPRYM